MRKVSGIITENKEIELNKNNEIKKDLSEIINEGLDGESILNLLGEERAKSVINYLNPIYKELIVENLVSKSPEQIFESFGEAKSKEIIDYLTPIYKNNILITEAQSEIKNNKLDELTPEQIFESFGEAKTKEIINYLTPIYKELLNESQSEVINEALDVDKIKADFDETDTICAILASSGGKWVIVIYQSELDKKSDKYSYREFKNYDSRGMGSGMTKDRITLEINYNIDGSAKIDGIVYNVIENPAKLKFITPSKDGKLKTKEELHKELELTGVYEAYNNVSTNTDGTNTVHTGNVDDKDDKCNYVTVYENMYYLHSTDGSIKELAESPFKALKTLKDLGYNKSNVKIESLDKKLIEKYLN